MHPAALLLPLLAACTDAPPTRAEDCTSIRSESDRDECYLTILPAAFRTDPEAGARIVEEKIASPINRDFAWYKITSEVDPHSNRYCDRIEEDALAARCRNIVARPHLHRDLAPGPPPGPSPTR